MWKRCTDNQILWQKVITMAVKPSSRWTESLNTRLWNDYMPLMPCCSSTPENKAVWRRSQKAFRRSSTNRSCTAPQHFPQHLRVFWYHIGSHKVVEWKVLGWRWHSKAERGRVRACHGRCRHGNSVGCLEIYLLCQNTATSLLGTPNWFLLCCFSSSAFTHTAEWAAESLIRSTDNGAALLLSALPPENTLLLIQAVFIISFTLEKCLELGPSYVKQWE